MAIQKPPCQKIYPWLQENLGKNCLAPLTSTDARALEAAVQILELYCTDHDEEILDAFTLVVSKMQPETRELAFHAIAMVLDWHNRGEIWGICNLPPIDNRRTCAFEPGAQRQAA